MVGIPAHGARQVQTDLAVEQKQRGDFVRHGLRGMIVTVVHKGRDSLFLRIRQTELGAAYGIRLKSDAEHLGFKGHKHLFRVSGLRKYLVKRSLEAGAGADAVGGIVLVAVGDPYIDYTGHSRFLGKILSKPYAALAVADPVVSDLLVGRGQSEIIFHHGVREKCGIEVNTQSPLLGIVHPPLEVTGSDVGAVGHLALFVHGVA